VKVFFDQGTPAPLRRYLAGHEVATAHERGWSQLKNGALITATEQAGFNVFVTTDQNLRYQQNLAGRKVAIVVIMTTSWPRIQSDLPPVLQAIESAKPGAYLEVTVAAARSAG
jgi:predicted nuclease of predicted toxin-antitoxin system